MIRAISAQDDESFTCVVEDVDQYNTYSDMWGNGNGGLGNEGEAYLFALNSFGVPLLKSGIGTDLFAVGWDADLLSRFAYTR